MIERGLAVLSGISTQVASSLQRQLKSQGIAVAFVRAGGATTEYLDRLLDRSLGVAKGMFDSDVRVSGILVSCIDQADEPAERQRFFPALRRVEVDRAFRNDIGRASTLSRIITRAIKSETEPAFRRLVSPKGEARLLLPLRNASDRHVRSNFDAIYDGDASDISQRVRRTIVQERRGRSYRYRSLVLTPIVNGQQHPIRRVTQTAVCDIQALFRFGVLVPHRFEFDVSHDRDITSVSFYQCGGDFSRPPSDATHLNMRINDDHKAGRK